MMKQIGVSFFMFLLLISSDVFGLGEITTFTDDFDGYVSGWTPSQSGDGARIYPYSNDGTISGGSGITNYEPSSYSAGSRTNANSWNGWRIANSSNGAAIEILTTGGIDNSGCLRITYPPTAVSNEDIGLIKWLGEAKTNREIYLRFYFKYDSGQNFRFNGNVNPNPTSNTFWKQVRIWTGVNLLNYDKDGGETLPAEPGMGTGWTDESNWRVGVWVPLIRLTDWGPTGKPFFSENNWWWSTSCVSGVGEDGSICGTQCDSQTSPNPTSSDDSHCGWDVWSAAGNTDGHLTTYANSGNALDTDGSFTEDQDWHWIEYHFKNNSYPGAADGGFELWIDGVKLNTPVGYSQSVKASMSPDSDDSGMNYVQLMANHFYLTENNSVDQYLYIDNVAIATSGPIGAAASSTPTPTASGLVSSGVTF